MQKKIVFLDIDGTLTEAGQAVPPQSAVDAIKQAQKNGHYIFICTGRNYGMAKPLLKYDFDGAIMSAGGYIIYNNEVIYDCPMTPEEKERAIAAFEKHGIHQIYESCDHTYMEPELADEFARMASGGKNSELERWRKMIREAFGMKMKEEYQGEPLYKLVLMGPTKETMEEAAGELNDIFRLCCHEGTSFGYVNGEIINRKFNKGTGMKIVCDKLGASLEDTIAFGDSENDREMIEAAAVGICMENGCEALKAIADDVCPAVSDDGIAKAFKKYGLI